VGCSKIENRIIIRIVPKNRNNRQTEINKGMPIDYYSMVGLKKQIN
jgi:hypothetical protein